LTLLNALLMMEILVREKNGVIAYMKAKREYSREGLNMRE